MWSGGESNVSEEGSSRLLSARRDAIVLTVLITAVLLLIWNGSAFFQHIRFTGNFGPEVRIASTALTLNVALILFGWRRYADLQHETEKRIDGETRAEVAASSAALGTVPRCRSCRSPSVPWPPWLSDPGSAKGCRMAGTRSRTTAGWDWRARWG